MIGDIKIQAGWLRVQKIFNDDYSKNAEYGCSTDEHTSVMLKTSMDDNLKQMGLSREITNRIQKLRKSTGVSIDDQIEVYFTAPAKGALTAVLDNHSDKIRDLIKMPFMHLNKKQPNQVVIGHTLFENDNESVEITICKQAVHVDEEAVAKSYQGVNVNVVHCLLNSFNPEALKKQLESSNGIFRTRLDGTDVELKHKEHFYLSGRERESTK